MVEKKKKTYLMTRANDRVQILLSINSFIGHSHLHSFRDHLASIALQSWVVMAETVWSAKLRIFTFCSFTEKVCLPWFMWNPQCWDGEASRPFRNFSCILMMVVFGTGHQEPLWRLPDGIYGNKHLWIGSQVCIFRFVSQCLLTIFLSLIVWCR